MGLFSADQQMALVKVGMRPNGLAYDAGRGLLVAANVGDLSRPGSFGISVVDEVPERWSRVVLCQ